MGVENALRSAERTLKRPAEDCSAQKMMTGVRSSSTRASARVIQASFSIRKVNQLFTHR